MIVIDRTPSTRRRLLLLAVGACMVITGCRAASPFYKPTSLPAQLHAQAVTNSAELDLSRLAQSSIPNDLIARGDVVEVNVAAGFGSDEQLKATARVSERGEILLPHVGLIRIEGMKLPVAEAAIATACIQQQVFRSPQVTVVLDAPKVNRVTVVGAVKEQGVYELRSGGSDLLAAITAAGGLEKEAGTVVEIRHPGTAKAIDNPAIAGQIDGNQTVGHQLEVESVGARNYKVDLASMSSDLSTQGQLEDGTVVMIQRRDPVPVEILGLVKKPDRYEIPAGKNMRLLAAISAAGGLSNPVADKVFVIRKRTDEMEPSVIQVSLREAKRNGIDNILLEPGDTVSVEQTPGTVMYDVAQFVGFGVSGRLF
jgi:polysaccharide export outer membrane protein